MADLNITPANVKAGSAAVTASGYAGETVAAGKTVYQAAGSKKWMLADSNSATAEARAPKGVALNGASLDQPITVQKRGDLAVGAVLTAGTTYYQSDTPGGICPLADVASGEYVTIVGIAKSTSVLNLAPLPSGVAL